MSPAAPETRIHHFHSISAQSSAVSGYGGLRYGSGLVRARREDRFTVNLSGTAGICPVSSETELFCFYRPLLKVINLRPAGVQNTGAVKQMHAKQDANRSTQIKSAQSGSAQSGSTQKQYVKYKSNTRRGRSLRGKGENMNEEIRLIALRISDMREIRGISQEEMARKMGMSREEYISYENGEQDFSFSFLYKASGILGVEMAELLTGDMPKLDFAAVVRAGKGLRYERRKDYEHSHLAFNFKGRKADPFFVTVRSDCKPGQRIPNSHESQEFMYIVSGTLLFRLGDFTTVLHEGDSVYYDCTRPHDMYAVECDECKFITVIIK